MLLSIGMIVKNEEKFLRGCLTSLRPILENVQSELIIFDTGSTDATVEIAREFTPHVYEIEWRGDFAWARNHTLDKATGEWFMFVDADEVFTDTSDLVAFFNSGEYEKYNCATYRWRNVNANNLFSHYRVTRLFKREKGMRFAGKIHEGVLLSLPKKDLDSIADHFGYYETQNKRGRNLPPLLEMYDENPNDVRVIYHIVKEYASSDATPAELDEVKKFIEIGLNETGENQEDIYYHIFNYQLVCNFANKNDSDGVIKTANKYLKGLKYTHQALLDMLHMKTIAHHRLRQYPEAAKSAEQAFDVFEKCKAGKLDLDISIIMMLSENSLGDKFLYLSHILINHVLAGDSTAAFKWAEIISKEPGGNFEICGIAAMAANQAESDEVRKIAAGLEQKYPLFALPFNMEG